MSINKNHKMYIIGISAYYHDSSICVFKDNHLIYACEEEKFTGIKHDCSFPSNALNYAIKHYKINNKKKDKNTINKGLFKIEITSSANTKTCIH